MKQVPARIVSSVALSDSVQFETCNRCAIITIDRPDFRNAVDESVSLGIEAGLDRLEESDDLWAGKASTINRRCSAIARAHRLAGFLTPLKGVAKETMAGIRRTLGTAPHQVAPIGLKELKAMVAALPQSTKGIRDRALLLLGFAGALRRSELVALDVTDVTASDNGLLIMLRRSKTDQEGEGRTVGIPYGSHLETCPVRAVQAWLQASEITEGPIFRPVNQHGIIASTRLSDRSVARIIQSAAKRAGLDPEQFAGHSLRAGLATAAAAAGVSEHDIARTTGHRSVAVLRSHVRTVTVFERNASASVGL